MARHLYIGNAVAVSYSSGVLAAGAIDIQKLSATGPTPMLPGDTIADSSQFRIVQGNGTTNIVSPWIYGKDVINYGGKVHAAQTAQVFRIALATNATAASTHRVKIINKTNGTEPFEMKAYEYTVAASATPTTQCTALTTAINANVPHWVKTVTNNGTSIDLTGYKKGETKADGSIQEDLVEMTMADNMDGDNGTVATLTAQTAGSRGYGDGYYVKKMEEDLRGVNYGYYNRLELPNTPTLTTVVASPYSMIHIAATKDGSSSSQINGVDNIIELNIAFDNGTAALNSAILGILNPYMLSAGFANIPSLT